MKKLTATKTRTVFSFLLSLLAVIVVFGISLLLGAEKICLKQVFEGHKIARTILLQLRLPRSILVMISGFLLAGAGAVFQLFFRNPLAEPGIMGISSGATLGAVLAQTIGVTFSGFLISGINLFAFLGSITAGAIITLLATGKSGRETSVMLLLCGTALGTLYSAISSICLLTQPSQLHGIYTWILGSFNGRGWKEVLFIILPSVISVLLMLIMMPSLDLLTGGEQSAASLGLEVGKLRVMVLLCGSLAASAAVCAGGTISFVGLIAPHIVRKIFGSKAKILIPFSMLLGGILLLAADTIARIVISPAELPAGVITSILGVPFFLALCFNHRK